jgi:hypothetical protein
MHESLISNHSLGAKIGGPIKKGKAYILKNNSFKRAV